MALAADTGCLIAASGYSRPQAELNWLRTPDRVEPDSGTDEKGRGGNWGGIDLDPAAGQKRPGIRVGVERRIGRGIRGISR